MKFVTLEKEINENDEKLVLVSLLGTLIAIERNSLSIAEAEKFLFSPYMISKLRLKKCDEKILNILERGCELEDIASLIPYEMDNAISELEKMTLELLKSYKNFERDHWIKG